MKPTDIQNDISQCLKNIWVPTINLTCLWQILNLTTNLNRTFHFPHLSTYSYSFLTLNITKTKDNTINHPQHYPSALLLQIRPITNLGGK